MGIVADVDLSQIIVSIANAVSDANAVLNTDPQSTMAITRFEVNTTFTAVLSTPFTVEGPTAFSLRRESSEFFRVEDFAPAHVPGARFVELLQPSLHEAVLPSARTETARVQIKAVIETVPQVSPT